MKDVNDFVAKDIWDNKHKTLKDYLEECKRINENIEVLKLKKKQYDDLINSSEKDNSSGLTFKEKYVIYTMINNACLRNDGKSDLKIELSLLKLEFECLYDDLCDYLSIKNKIKILEERKREIFQESITFHGFDNEHYSEHCCRNHCFVVDAKELKCVYCGATTKDYSLSEEEFEFLVLCAKKQGILLEEFTKEDWPLLQVIIEKQNYRRSLRPELDIEDEDFLEKAEEQFFADEYEFTELEIALSKAHILDAQIYDDQKVNVKNPKYLCVKEKKKFLKNLEKELEEIQKTNSRFKQLLIEQCKTAKYEILILSGGHIPTLLEETADENDKIALAKAYYNLSNSDFRINSGYFAPSHRDNDAIFYDCFTANPEINNKILEMKLRRK